MLWRTERVSDQPFYLLSVSSNFLCNLSLLLLCFHLSLLSSPDLRWATRESESSVSWLSHLLFIVPACRASFFHRLCNASRVSLLPLCALLCFFYLMSRVSSKSSFSFKCLFERNVPLPSAYRSPTPTSHLLRFVLIHLRRFVFRLFSIFTLSSSSYSLVFLCRYFSAKLRQ